MDLISFFALRSFLFCLNCFPLKLRVKIVSALLHLFFFFAPAYRKIASRNIELVFPDREASWKEKFLNRCIASLAKCVVDFARMHTLDKEWVRNHVAFPGRDRFEAIVNSNPGKGIILATGHFGSFELLSYSAGLMGYPLDFVVRPFKSLSVDRWWNSVRESTGNKTIPRKGAFKGILRSLKSGRNVGILFDQNVQRKVAVFVDFFGRSAATTFALAMAAIQTEAPVVVCGLCPLGLDNYEMRFVELDFAELYQREDLSRDDKILQITQEYTRQYEKFILDFPEAWLWFHRRWKTAPEGFSEDFYQ